jgi:hypothetical protein
MIRAIRNTTTLLGETPGSLGLFDGADPALPQFSSADPVGAWHASIRRPLQLDNRTYASVAAPIPPAPYIALEDAQVIALKISTDFRKGAKSLNYQAVSGDFDKQNGYVIWTNPLELRPERARVPAQDDAR